MSVFEPRQATLTFVDGRDHKAGETFSVVARPRALFRAYRFKSIDSVDSFSLVDVHVAGRSQMAAPDSVLPLAVMLDFGAGELRFDTARCAAPITIVLRAERDCPRGFRCVIEGRAAQDAGSAASMTWGQLKALAEPVDVTEAVL